MPRHNPYEEQRMSDKPMYVAAHSDTKHSSGGMRGTMASAEYYVNEAKAKRDEILAQYAGGQEE